MPSSPTVSRSAAAQLGEQLVAGGVPEGVVVALEAVEVEEQERDRLLGGRLRAEPVEVDLQCAAAEQAGQGSVRTWATSALFSRTLIASRTITAIIVAAQSTVARPLAVLEYCIAKRPIITAAKTPGDHQLAPAVEACRAR